MIHIDLLYQQKLENPHFHHKTIKIHYKLFVVHFQHLIHYFLD